jgi:hypothetical protein
VAVNTKIALKVWLALLLLVLPAPVLAAVSVDHAKSVDFSQYKSFAWSKQQEVPDPELARKIQEAVDNELIAKGLAQVASNADLTITIRLSVHEERREEMDIFGYPTRWGESAARTGQTGEVRVEVEVGRLTVDLLDGASGLHLWRGTATRITSGKSEGSSKRIDKAVRKMFKDFPPQ